MNMNHNAKDQVLSLLQSYRATKRKIEQLRYELEHPARVTPDEMIEAMNFAKGDGEGRPSGRCVQQDALHRHELPERGG